MYYFTRDFGNKELKLKVFKLRLAHLPNIIDEELFVKIFGCTLEALAGKLINTTDKEEYQTIIANIKENKKILDQTDDFNDWVIQPNVKRIDLDDASSLVLDFNDC